MTQTIKEKVLSFLKQNKYIILSYALVFLVILAVYKLIGIYPFGSLSIVKADQFHGFLPDIYDIRDNFINGKSIFYSWNGSMGADIFGTLFYSVGGFVNILALFFDTKYATEFAAFVYLFRTPFAAVTFYVFGRKKFKRDDLILVAFSCMYALCSYVTAYHWLPQWLNAVIMLPLVALGLERLIKENKAILYCVSLSFAIFVQYGTAIFLCYFSVIYFFILLLTENNQKIKGYYINKIIKFTWFSLLAGGIAAFALIPALSGLGSSGYLKEGVPSFDIYNSFFRFYVNHYFGMHPTSLVFSSAIANIYTGILTLISFPFFIFNKTIKKKIKISYILFLFILFMISNVKLLTFLVHGMHMPAMMPHRFSFIYSFVLLITALYAIQEVKLFKIKHFVLFFIFSIGSSLILYLIYPQKVVPKTGRFSETAIFVSIILIVAYYLILICFKLIKCKKINVVISWVLLAIVTVELTGNAYNQISHMNDGLRTNLSLEFYDSMEVISKELANEQAFYRAEFKHENSLGEAKIYKYNGLNYFSGPSSALSSLRRRFGVTQVFANPTPLLNSIFGVKYLFNRRVPMPENFSLFELKRKEGNIYLYENPYVLPLGFMVDNEILNWSFEIKRNNPFDFQDEFVEKALGEYMDLFDPVFMEEDVITKYIELNKVDEPAIYNYEIDEELDLELVPQVTVRFIAPESKYTYIYVASAAATFAVVSIDGSDKLRQNIRSSGISNLDAGFVEAGSEITLTINMNQKTKDDYEDNDEEEFLWFGALGIYAAQMDFDVYLNIVDRLNTNGLDVTYYDEITVKGNISVDEESVLFTSIPYNRYWNVTVDGKPANISPLADALIGVKLYPGDHEIEFSYTEGKRLIPGTIISFVAILLFCLTIYAERKEKIPREKEAKTDE